MKYISALMITVFCLGICIAAGLIFSPVLNVASAGVSYVLYRGAFQEYLESLWREVKST